MVCKLAGLLAALPPPAPPTAQSFPPLAAQLSCQSETLRGHSSATMPLLCLHNQDATAVLQFSVCHTLHYSFLSVVVKFLSRAKKKEPRGLAIGYRSPDILLLLTRARKAMCCASSSRLPALRMLWRERRKTTICDGFR